MDYATQSLSTYNDFEGLAGLRAAAKNDQNKAVDKVAEQFESMFMHMMLKEMRKTVPESEFFNTPGVKLFQDMQDQQIALEVAKGSPLGIADMLKTSLERNGHIKTEVIEASNNIGTLRSAAFPLNVPEASVSLSRQRPVSYALDAYRNAAH